MTLLASEKGGFEELASGSLPSLGGNPLQPSWSRSLQELVASNQALVDGGLQQPTAAAQVLLGDRTDFGTLTASLKAPKHPKTEVFTSVEETTRKHRDGTIERILQKEREHTQKKLEQSLERQLEDDWSKERKWWINEIVGTRNLVDSTNSLVIRQPERQLGSSLQALPGPSHGYLTDTKASMDHRLNPRAVEDHHALVKSITPTSSLSEIFSKFQKLASAGGYETAWHLLTSIIPNLSSPINGAFGSLIHFCRQYQSIVKNRVASANLAGQDVVTVQNYGPGMAGTIAAYVKLEFGSNASIWHKLYYCLRCGDAVAAMNVLSVVPAAHDNFPEQPVVRNVVLQMSQQQGAASCVWEKGTPMVSSTDRDMIIDLYEKAQHLESNNKHKVGFLALLCGKLLSSFDTIEDYLFGRLWVALQDVDPASQIEGIGESIRKYGPGYFQAEDSGGWGYALPLLASQQFKTALAYLAEAGGSTGLMQAVHLGLAFSMSGHDVVDLGRQTSTGCLVTALLVKYANLLESESPTGAIAALDYLLRIPTKERSRQEIAALVARSHHLVDHLAGISTDVGRQNGLLDKYLPETEVSSILAQSAEIFRRQSNELPKAELSAKLFMLAGHYGSLLTLLNELLSPTDEDSDNKRHWCDQSQKFYSTYLAKRTLILASLEKEGDLKLVTTNRQLTELRSFFEHRRFGRYQEGLDIVARLGLLPFTQEELNEKQSNYRDLDPILKKQFPTFLAGSVHCLYGLHRKVKSESRGQDSSVEVRLKELQMKSRLMYIFAGLIDMPSSTKEDIQKMRNHMI